MAGKTVTFGNFELTRRIARGGMAEIFLAIERGLEGVKRQVVVKRILPDHVESDEFVTMFMDEARVAARLVHPNIAHIYSFGEVEGVYYLSMEYVDGLTSSKLGRACRPDPLPIEMTLKIVSETCAGLHHAHLLTDEEGTPLGVVHRDVSPQNIMVSRIGAVKLLDFGVARTATQSHSTGVGQLKGKLGYMAPEQFTGEIVDHRADIFSVGVVLWEMVSGERLYLRDSGAATMHAILNAPVPKVTRAGVPALLDEIIAKAMAKHPADRYQTAAEMQEVIDLLMARRTMIVTSTALGAFVEKQRDRLKELRADAGADGGRAQPSLASSLDLSSTPDDLESSGQGETSDVITAGATPGAAPAQEARQDVPVDVADDGSSSLQPIPGGSGSASSPQEVVEADVPAEPTRRKRRALLVTILAFVGGAGLSLVLLLVLMNGRDDPGAVAHGPGGSGTDSHGAGGPMDGGAGAGEAGARGAAVDAPSRVDAPSSGDAAAAPADASRAVEGGPSSGRRDAGKTRRDAGKTRRDGGTTRRDGGTGKARRPPGKLYLGTDPWTRVRIGGRSYGTTPLMGVSVPSGSHSVVLLDGDGNRHRRRIQIRPGQTTKVHWSLRGSP